MVCTVYIDESGDTGITKLRSRENSDSSEYFAMGAMVIQQASEENAREQLEELQRNFKKKKLWKHSTDLTHPQKLKFCRATTNLNVRLFGVISYKPTLGQYKEEIDWDPHKFYNKCAKYLGSGLIARI